MEIQKPKILKATFNKDVLVNTYFEHTELFRQEATKKMQT